MTTQHAGLNRPTIGDVLRRAATMHDQGDFDSMQALVSEVLSGGNDVHACDAVGSCIRTLAQRMAFAEAFGDQGNRSR
jgi:hypothetical protein